MPSDERELRLPCVVICRPRDMAARARLQSRGRLTPITMFLHYRPSGAHRFSGPRPHILKIAPINILCRQHLSNLTASEIRKLWVTVRTTLKGVVLRETG